MVTTMSDEGGAWVFMCDGCNKVTPASPVCVECGAKYVFHGTPDGDKVFARLIDGMRRARVGDE